MATKLVLLFLEEAQKRSLVTARSKDLALESTGGPINCSVFWWLNQLFFKGFKSLLHLGDLGSIDDRFDSGDFLSTLDHVWQANHKSSKHALLTSTVSAFQTTFFDPIVPRLCLAGFRFAQPFLINQVIDFVGEPDKGNASGIADGLRVVHCLLTSGLLDV